MITTIDIDGHGQQEIEIWHVCNKFKSYGHWRIEMHFIFNEHQKTFGYVTTDSEFVDMISDMTNDEETTYEEIIEAYHSNFFERYFEERVAQWIEEILDEE